MDKTRMSEYLEKAPIELTEVSNFISVGMKEPRKISIGLGVSKNVGKDASQLVDGKTALLISDEILKNLGTVDLIVSFLNEEGFTVETFTSVEAEPHIETAESLYDLSIDKNISVIVGLGGGSVMDMSKLTAQALGNKVKPGEFGDRKIPPNSNALPLILLPTTSGTGSEVSFYFVVSYGEEKRFFSSPNLLPDISMIDPLLTISMPPRVTATTGIDALSHAIEAVMHKKSSPMCEAIAMGSITMITKYLRRAVFNGEDLEARYNMSVGSAMAMMGFNMAGGLWAHSVSYIIPLIKEIPHGLGCSLGLPFLMDFNRPVIPGCLAKIANAMGELNGNCNEINAARKAVKAVAELIVDIHLPLTLKEIGIESEVLEEMALKMVEMYPRPLNPRNMGKAEAIDYWKAMYEGKLL
jgi:alcohol dehydrogenase